METNTPLTFKKWLILEQLKQQLSIATGSDEFPDRVFAYLSVAFPKVNQKDIQNDSWENSVFLLMKAFQEFQPDKKLPILNDAPKNTDKPSAWDYDGRTWAYWSHLIAKSYSWTLEYIADLDVNEALARVQEILTDEQLEHEFLYGLSEVAYPYNKSTKQSKYKPMPRPYWMKSNVPPLRISKFRADMMPVGAIEDLSGMPSQYNPLRDYVQKKKETKPAPSP